MKKNNQTPFDKFDNIIKLVHEGADNLKSGADTLKAFCSFFNKVKCLFKNDDK